MISPEDSQMSVDAEPDAPDTTLKSSCQRARWLTGTGNLAAALQQRQVRRQSPGGTFTYRLVLGIRAGGPSRISCHSCWPL